MLLFSTILDMVPELTPEKFVEMVIDWNNTNKHPVNIIKDVHWTRGPRVSKYGDSILWMEILDYEDKNIMAVRYEKTEDTGVIWDTDYIMNFNEHKLSIQLERSYTDEPINPNAAFSTPYFLAKIIDAKVVKLDSDLEVLREPIAVDATNVSVLTDIATKKTSYKLPVVYVSKKEDGEYPVDINMLAYRLKGVAHVLAQEGDIDASIRKAKADRGDYRGDIGIYYTNGRYVHMWRKYKPKASYNKESVDKIVDMLIKHCTLQKIDLMYTWQGVNNALLMDSLNTQRNKMLEAEEARNAAESEKESAQLEADKIYDAFAEEFDMLHKKIEDLTKRNERLTSENYGLLGKLNNTNDTPVIFMGKEQEFFPDEIKEFILDAISDAIKSTNTGTRRYDILKDILAKNQHKNIFKEKGNKLKQVLQGYKNITSASINNLLKDMGFVLTEDGKHVKAIYNGDPRYTIALAKTPSDNRSGMNIANTIIDKIL